MNRVPDPSALLLPGVSQYEVDFVIPRVAVDVPVGIDPFLLYKSRDPEYRDLHRQLLNAFNAGIAAISRGDAKEAARIFDFPEVSPIGLGYTQKSKRGSGVGAHLANLIIETLVGSPDLQTRGVHHVEEMQLVSAGIGPDRISDIAANIMKKFLILYTQRQCEIWKLPLKTGVPIQHVYDPSVNEWIDAYEDLPVSPLDGLPILLVPRRIVRMLPWINYDNFLRTEFRSYLAAKQQRKPLALKKSSAGNQITGTNDKNGVVTIARKDIALVERYVRTREAQASDAQPAFQYIDEDACKEAEDLKKRLADVRPGRDQAADYQRLILEILNYLFNPELIDGKPEVRTIDSTERRDIIFTNDSDESFWDYVRTAHDNLMVMFETKNTIDLGLTDINQTATYLGDRLGRLGIIVTRGAPRENVQRKIFSVWNDSAPNRKIILTLTDGDVCHLLDLRCKESSPTKWLQAHYRNFRTSVQ